LYGTHGNKEYDEEAEFRKFECERKIIDELFPNAQFEISIELENLDSIITTKKEIKLLQTFDCYCYQGIEGTSNANTKSDKLFIIKSNNNPMTIRYIINELIKQNFTLECNHRFLEELQVNGHNLEYFLGS
jgi:hypothetical protein